MMKAIAFLAAISSASAAVSGIDPRNAPSKTNLHVIRQGEPLDANAGCENANKEEPCTIISASEAFEFYGERTPRDVADELWDRCIGNTCNIKDFEVSTRDITGVGPYETTLTATVHGEWLPEIRHALIFAMTELVGGTQVQYTKTEQRPPVQGADVVTMDVWKAPKDMGITRFVWGGKGWAIQGSVTLSVAKTEDEGSTCEGLLGVLETIAGTLHEGLATALGALEPVCNAFN